MLLLLEVVGAGVVLLLLDDVGIAVLLLLLDVVGAGVVVLGHGIPTARLHSTDSVAGSGGPRDDPSHIAASSSKIIPASKRRSQLQAAVRALRSAASTARTPFSNMSTVVTGGTCVALGQESSKAVVGDANGPGSLAAASRTELAL